MNLLLSKSKEYVLFQAESTKEITFLEKKFPGLIKSEGPHRCCVAKPRVVRNLVTRIKAQGFKVRTEDAEVAALAAPREHIYEHLPEGFQYHTTPLLHQDIALKYLWANSGGGLLLDPGLGKTKIIYDYVHAIKTSGASGKYLVVCPKSLLFVWEIENKKHRPELSVYALPTYDCFGALKTLRVKIADAGGVATKEQDKDLKKLKQMCEDVTYGIDHADVVVVNYNRAVSAEALLKKYRWELIAVDEGLIKDPYSNRSETLNSIGEHCVRKVVMSGTLINNAPTDVFNPVKFMERSLVGGAYSKFQDRYCDFIEVRKRGDSGRVEKTGRKILKGYVDVDEVVDILGACSLIMRKEVWLKDLPAKKHIPVSVPVSDKVMEMYNDLSSNFITQVNGKFVEVKTPLTLLSKLSQLSNGFVYTYDDEEDDYFFDIFGAGKGKKSPDSKPSLADRETLFLDEQPKVKALRDLLTGDLKGRKVMIWYNLTAERELIEAELTGLGITTWVIAGKKGGKDKMSIGDKVSAFNSHQGSAALLCQAKSVNYGVTVLGHKPEMADSDIDAIPDVETEVYTHVFYSLSYSLEMLIQQQDRSHRIGMTRAPEYYYLLADTPIEKAVFSAVENKREFCREKFLQDTLGVNYRP